MRGMGRSSVLVGAVAALVAVAAACSGGASSGPQASGDASAPADGAIVDAPLACPPASLGGWTPAVHPPQAPQPTACSALLVNDFYQSCLGPASSSDACEQSWGAGADAAHQLCEACLVTPSTASAW